MGATALLAAHASGASAAGIVATMDTDKEPVLAGGNGMTLYTFRNDAPGVSTCYEQCAENWPSLLATGDVAIEAPYTVIERDDGTRQLARDGMPLYYWIRDIGPGDTTGDGMNGLWDVARP